MRASFTPGLKRGQKRAVIVVAVVVDEKATASGSPGFRAPAAKVERIKPGTCRSSMFHGRPRCLQENQWQFSIPPWRQGLPPDASDVCQPAGPEVS